MFKVHYRDGQMSVAIYMNLTERPSHSSLLIRNALYFTLLRRIYSDLLPRPQIEGPQRLVVAAWLAYQGYLLRTISFPNPSHEPFSTEFSTELSADNLFKVLLRDYMF